MKKIIDPVPVNFTTTPPVKHKYKDNHRCLVKLCWYGEVLEFWTNVRATDKKRIEKKAIHNAISRLAEKTGYSHVYIYLHVTDPNKQRCEVHEL